MSNDNEISPPKYLLSLLEDAIGKKTLRWTVPDCGLSSALRFSVMLEDNSRVFVKASTDDLTEQWLRTEHFVLSSVRGAFMPYVVDWIDMPGVRPILISQDLSQAYWPASHNGVAWRKDDFDLLLNAIKALSSHEVPSELPAMQNRQISAWSEIADDPDAFLTLGVCSEGWFRRSIDALMEAESNADVRGNCLVHGDIRSDNICISGSRIIFVDWSHAARGNGHHDLAKLLPTLCLEGGPAPYLVMPHGGSEAALGCAGHVKRLLEDRLMPQWLKKVFTQLIAIELEWTTQCLGLEKPDGIRWSSI